MYNSLLWNWYSALKHGIHKQRDRFPLKHHLSPCISSTEQMQPLSQTNQHGQNRTKQPESHFLSLFSQHTSVPAAVTVLCASNRQRNLHFLGLLQKDMFCWCICCPGWFCQAGTAQPDALRSTTGCPEDQMACSCDGSPDREEWLNYQAVCHLHWQVPWPASLKFIQKNIYIYASCLVPKKSHIIHLYSYFWIWINNSILTVLAMAIHLHYCPQREGKLLWIKYLQFKYLH